MPPERESGAVLQRLEARRSLLGPDLGPGGHDPLLLSGMEQAVQVLGRALREGRRIAVYGDYDVDGVTATALLVRSLAARGAQALPYIPSREAEGYGLNEEALLELGRQGVEVVVSVDCGTTAVEVAAARPRGMELVITDHHLPLREGEDRRVRLPDVEALVNPQQPGDEYPFKGLAGAGVAYKLVQALEQVGLLPGGTAAQQLPLVALGTVADLMPLVDENRQLVRQGLFTWADSAPLGLLALARAAGIEGPPTSSDLGFSLGPRINAAGRMREADLALACCLAQDPLAASSSARELERLNGERRLRLKEALEVAQELVEGMSDDLPAIVVGHETFHPGVVGLVAGRLADEYQRPAFAYSRQGAEWRGSARAVDGVNIVEALAVAAPFLLRYGGHQGAGGFSLPGDSQSAGEFSSAVQKAVAIQRNGNRPQRRYAVDAVASLADCNFRLADQLARLEPFGRGNPQVLLCALDCQVTAAAPFGKGREHLRVGLADQSGSAEAITFNRPWLHPHLPVGRRVDVLFELEVNRWKGREQLRLLLRDLRPTRGAGAPASSGAPADPGPQGM
ncbi:MAG: single-stranded-DNA-specific exonuclease RecJ [Candidatus Dormibacteria bacterium]